MQNSAVLLHSSSKQLGCKRAELGLQHQTLHFHSMRQGGVLVPNFPLPSQNTGNLENSDYKRTKKNKPQQEQVTQRYREQTVLKLAPWELQTTGKRQPVAIKQTGALCKQVVTLATKPAASMQSR